MPRDESEFPAAGAAPKAPRRSGWLARAARSYADSSRRIILDPILFSIRSLPKLLSAGMALLFPTIFCALALLAAPGRGAFLGLGALGAFRIALLWLFGLFLWSLLAILLRAFWSWLGSLWARFESIAPELPDTEIDEEGLVEENDYDRFQNP